MSDGGKGSDRRPGKGYQEGWDRIFNKPAPKPPKAPEPKSISEFQNWKS